MEQIHLALHLHTDHILAEMKDGKIRIIINSTYQLFDHLVKVPFGIVFGFVRHSFDDIDPRALRLNVTKSTLDVLYGRS